MSQPAVRTSWTTIGWIALALCIALSPNIYLFVHNLFVLKFSFAVRILIRVLFAFNLFAIPLFFNGFRVKTYFYFLTILVLFAPVALVTVALYDFLPTTWMMLGILQTNSDEALEFIRGLEWVIGVWVVILAAYMWIVWKKIPAKITFARPVRRSFFGATFAFLVIISAWTASIYGIQNLAGNIFTRVLGLSYPAGLVASTVEAASEIRSYKGQSLVDFTFHAVDRDTIQARKIVVVVLGESSRYKNWGVNGYERNTSPRLAKEENLVTFSDVISHAPMTGLSLPHILTRAAPGEDVPIEKSALEALGEAGYDTYWISNQPAEPSTLRFIRDAGYYQFIGKDHLDEDLLPYLQRAIDSSRNNLFVLLHTLGNHYNYAKRYPESFNEFTPSTFNVRTGSKDKSDAQLIINSYDNSVLYADYILSSVIEMVRGTNAVSSVLFISDHGELLFDDGLDKLGHGIGTVSPLLYHIPMFAWFSDEFTQTFPDRVAAAKLRADAPLSTSNFFHSLMGMSGISMDGMRSEKDLCSDAFVPARRVVMIREGQLVLFDSLKTNSTVP